MNTLLVMFLAIVVLSDIRTYKIKNWMLLIGLLIGILYRIQAGNYLEGLIAFLIPFFLLYPFFVLGALGAADIKLFCVLGLWMKPIQMIYFLFYAFLVSAVIAFGKGLISGVIRERMLYLARYFSNCFMCKTILPFEYNSAKKEADKGIAIHMAFPIAITMIVMKTIKMV